MLEPIDVDVMLRAVLRGAFHIVAGAFVVVGIEAQRYGIGHVRAQAGRQRVTSAALTDIVEAVGVDVVVSVRVGASHVFADAHVARLVTAYRLGVRHDGTEGIGERLAGTVGLCFDHRDCIGRAALVVADAVLAVRVEAHRLGRRHDLAEAGREWLALTGLLYGVEARNVALRFVSRVIRQVANAAVDLDVGTLACLLEPPPEQVALVALPLPRDA